MINTNGHGISHQHNNNSSNGVYNGMAAQNPNNNNNIRLSKQNSITSPPLSTSSSSSSSSSSTNGLSISISNQNGSNSNLNGNLIYPSNGINHTRQNSDHINNATNGHNGNNNNQFYLQQQQQQQHQMQQLHSNPPQVPLYQSSPIPAPPPPPPPIGSLFANQNFINSQTNNNNNADNYSQKIYDVIPDTNTYMPSSNGQNVRIKIYNKKEWNIVLGSKIEYLFKRWRFLKHLQECNPNPSSTNNLITVEPFRHIHPLIWVIHNVLRANKLF